MTAMMSGGGGGGGGGTNVVLADQADGTLEIVAGAATEQAQRPINELDLGTETVDPAVDLLAVWDDTLQKHVSVPANAVGPTWAGDDPSGFLGVVESGALGHTVTFTPNYANLGFIEGVQDAVGQMVASAVDGLTYDDALNAMTASVANAALSDQADGTLAVTLNSVTQESIRPIDELTDLPPGTLDPLNDEVVVFDASSNSHVAVKVSELRAPIQITYYDTVTAPAAPIGARKVTLPLNKPTQRAYGFTAIIGDATETFGEVWAAGQQVNGVAAGTNAVSEHSRLPSVIPASLTHPVTGVEVEPPVFVKCWVNTFCGLYLDKAGKLWFRGSNWAEQSGIPSWAAGDTAEIPTIIPFFVDNGITIVNVELASSREGNDDYPSVYAVDSTGKLYVWGRNNNGQLGIGNTTDTPTPTLVAGALAGKTVIQVSAAVSNGETAFVLCSDGTLYGAGAQPNGELGIGSTAQQNSWTLSRNAVAFVAAHGWASFIIDTAGKVWGTGNNGTGWFGRGNTTNSTSWVQSTSFTGVADQIYLGSQSNRSIWIRENGTIWYGGENSNSQLGLGAGSTAQQNNHVAYTGAQFPPQGKISEIVVAGNVSSTVYARTSDGEVWSAGYNAYGQRGIGSREDSAAVRSSWRRAAWHRPIQAIRPFAQDFSGTMVVVDDLGRIATCGYDTQMFDSLAAWSSALRNYPIATY